MVETFKEYYTYDDNGNYVHVLPVGDCLSSLQVRIDDMERTIALQKMRLKNKDQELKLIRSKPGAYNLFSINRHDFENLMKYMECTDLACGNPQEYEFVCTVKCKNSNDTLTFPLKFRE